MTKARWIPDPKQVEEVIEETGMVELVPPIQNFNLVSVKPKKKTDWNRILVVGSAVTPSAVCMATAEMFIHTSPLTYGIFAGLSIGWTVIVMLANTKRKIRSRVR